MTPDFRPRGKRSEQRYHVRLWRNADDSALSIDVNTIYKSSKERVAGRSVRPAPKLIDVAQELL